MSDQIRPWPLVKRGGKGSSRPRAAVSAAGAPGDQWPSRGGYAARL